MKSMIVLLNAVFMLAAAGYACAQSTFRGNAEVSLQFSPSNPSMADSRIEVRIVADFGAVKTDSGAGPVLMSFSMPVGFDPSYVRLVSATAGQTPGYSPATFAFSEPGAANGRGLVTVMNTRTGSQPPGTQVELGSLVFEIRRPGNAWFIAGSARTTHPGTLAAVPSDAGTPVQRIAWADHTYVVRIGAGTVVPSLLCPSWFSTPEIFQGMALLNEGTASASIQMFGWSPSGTLVQTGSATNPSTAITLPGRNQDARLADQVFKSQLPMSIERGWIEVRADTPDVSGFFLQGVNDGAVTRQMDGVPMTYTPASRLIFPLVRDPNRRTEISLTNPGDTSVSVEMRVLGPSGQLLRTVNTQMLPRETFSQVVTDATSSNGVYVDVRASGGKIIGLERIGTEESFAALIGQDAELASTRLSGPQFATGYLGNDLRIDTHIALVNPSSSPTSVILRLLDDNGHEITAPAVYTLAAASLISIEGWELFGLPDPVTTSTIITGSLVVESDLGLIGAMTFGDPVNGSYLAALPLMSSSSAKREIYFGHVAAGRLGNIDYFTGLALANPSTTDTANIQIELHDKDGRILAQTTTPYNLAPGGKTANLVQQLIPNFPESQFGGYMHLVSDIEVNAYMLIGDNYYNFLAAIP